MLTDLRDRRGPAWFFNGQSGCYCCAATAGIYHVFFGRNSTGSSLSSGYKYQSASWIAITSAPQARSSVAMAYLENGIAYSAYGLESTGTDRVCNKYDTNTDSWTGLATAVAPYRYNALSIMLTNMFVFGGEETGFLGSKGLNDNDKYTIGSDSWSSVGSLPSPGRKGGFAWALNSKGFYAGGSDQFTTALKDCDSYDPSSDSWTAKTDSSTQRLAGGSFSIGNDGFAVYGREGTTQTITRRSDYYTESTDTWNTTTDGPTPARISGASAGISGNSAGYYTGGEYSGPTYSADHEEYVSGTWSSLTDLSASRYETSGASC